MSIDYTLIGRRIKQKRKKLGKTQDNISEALSVSVGYISQIERGATKVSLDTLSEIAGCLGCDIGELVTGVTPAHESFLNQEFQELLGAMNYRQRKMLFDLAGVIVRQG